MFYFLLRTENAQFSLLSNCLSILYPRCSKSEDFIKLIFYNYFSQIYDFFPKIKITENRNFYLSVLKTNDVSRRWFI